MRLPPALAGTLCLLIAAPAAAQQSADDARYDRALAAGYKAQFLCSGLWDGGRTRAEIEADELTGIYDRIAAIVPTLPAEIDEAAQQVRVSFADDVPPRIAVRNKATGCTGMPIGWTPAPAPGPDVVFMQEPQSAQYNRLAPGALDDRAWPMGDAKAKPPSGWRTRAISAVIDQAFGDGSDYGGHTSALLVLQNGKIVGERYMPGYDLHEGQRTWSVAKSIAGTFIGYATLHGALDVTAPLALPQWSSPVDPRRAITLDQAMRMSSGLVSDTPGNRTDPVYMGGAAVTERAAAWPLLHPPGGRFRYANNDILLATLAARSAVPDVLPQHVFDKLGMTRTFAQTDWQGNYILSSQVWTTARDLARLGQLYLNDGLWNGERLLPGGWRAYVSTAAGPQPEGEFGYGASFWLLARSQGVPPDTFGAFGNRGQYLIVIPSRDMVIVRRGYDTAEARFAIAAFTRAIVAAAEGPERVEVPAAAAE